MKNKLMNLGAVVLLASVFAMGVKTFTPAAYARPLDPKVAAVLASSPVEATEAMFQQVDNKAPWANTTAPQQFGQWYEFADVYNYVAGTNWTATLTEAGAGESDPVNSLIGAVTAVKGSGLIITTDSADNDRAEVDNASEPYLLEAGDTLVFTANITTGSDVTECDLGLGVGITDTDWLGDTAIMSDGIFFEKNDGDAYLDLVFAKDAASTSDYTRVARVYDLAASTSYKLCFIVTSNSSDSTKARYRVFVNDQQVASGSVSTDVPNDEYLAIKMGVQAGEAAAKTMIVRSIGVAESY